MVELTTRKLITLILILAVLLVVVYFAFISNTSFLDRLRNLLPQYTDNDSDADLSGTDAELKFYCPVIIAKIVGTDIRFCSNTECDQFLDVNGIYLYNKAEIYYKTSWYKRDVKLGELTSGTIKITGTTSEISSEYLLKLDGAFNKRNTGNFICKTKTAVSGIKVGDTIQFKESKPYFNNAPLTWTIVEELEGCKISKVNMSESSTFEINVYGNRGCEIEQPKIGVIVNNLEIDSGCTEFSGALPSSAFCSFSYILDERNYPVYVRIRGNEIFAGYVNTMTGCKILEASLLDNGGRLFANFSGTNDCENKILKTTLYEETGGLISSNFEIATKNIYFKKVGENIIAQEFFDAASDKNYYAAGSCVKCGSSPKVTKNIYFRGEGVVTSSQEIPIETSSKDIRVYESNEGARIIISLRTENFGEVLRIIPR